MRYYKKVMRYLTYEIKKFRYVTKFKTRLNGQIYGAYIKKPSIEKLLRMGFYSVNRGYRKDIGNKRSLHVLPTGCGWYLHIDKEKRNKHHVLKSDFGEYLIKKFIRKYPII